MSFDIHYHTCNLGEKKKKVTNPFTRQTMDVFADDGLTADECAAVSKLLANAKAKGPDQLGCWVVKFRDGGGAEVFLDNLDGSGTCEGCMVSISGITPNLVNFIYDLARVGNMVMTPVIEESVSVVTSAEQQKKIKARWPDAVVVGSADGLQVLLDKGVGAWQKYRDRAVGS
jgi:hypothetical protein